MHNESCFIKVFRLGLKIFFIFILYNLFFILTPGNEIPSATEDKDNVTLFLETLMIREGGLYTLLGSKPMVLFNVTDTIDISEKGLEHDYNLLKLFFERAEKDPENHSANGATLPTYETYKRKCLTNHKALLFCDRKKTWEEWSAFAKDMSNPVYKLFSRPLAKGDLVVGLFVNIPQALYILKKYHAEFTQRTGIEFEAEKILESFENEEAIFWDKVLKDHFLLGLMLGYGEKNAYLFAWMTKNQMPHTSVSIVRFPEFAGAEKYAKQSMKRNVTLNDLYVPYFVSFEITDETVDRFVREREKIIEFLKNKDFIPFVINCLKGKKL